MITVGLTGGIGSGKSTVAKVFAILGVPVFNSDAAAKSCYLEQNMINLLQQRYGLSVFSNLQVDFKKLSNIVFKQSQELVWLNQQIHPLVKQKFEHWKNLQNSVYVIKEAAILFESGAYLSCDKIITVVAGQEIRIQRVQKRDAISEAEVLERIKFQCSDDQKIKKSDFLILNNSELIVPQVLAIHQDLLS